MTRPARKPATPDDGPSCAGCKHWREGTVAVDETRWGFCHAGPPTVVGDGLGGTLCDIPWTELPFDCGAHTPRTH